MAVNFTNFERIYPSKVDKSILGLCVGTAGMVTGIIIALQGKTFAILWHDDSQTWHDYNTSDLRRSGHFRFYKYTKGED